MQKSLLFLFFLGAVLAARAEWVVVQQDGTAATVSHADVRRITFEDGNMVTLMADGTQQSVPIADIDKCLFFAPTQTGISQTATPQAAVRFAGDEMTLRAKRTAKRRSSQPTAPWCSAAKSSAARPRFRSWGCRRACMW